MRGSAPPNSLMGAFQQGPQGAKPGNALLSLLQGSSQNAFGQVLCSASWLHLHLIC